jgi:hypothetical protein
VVGLAGLEGVVAGVLESHLGVISFSKGWLFELRLGPCRGGLAWSEPVMVVPWMPRWESDGLEVGLLALRVDLIGEILSFVVEYGPGVPRVHQVLIGNHNFFAIAQLLDISRLPNEFFYYGKPKKNYLWIGTSITFGLTTNTGAGLRN